jgi:uncharacterized membrane protein
MQEETFMIIIAVMVLFFLNGESGMDLHTAIVHALTK